MTAPLISIIVPTHNDGQYINKLFAALLEDDSFSIEVIVVDDASTDDTPAILDSLSKQDHRIRVITHSSTKGPACARGAGIHAASGDWICCVDSDDWFTASALKTWYEYATKNNLDVLIGNAYRFQHSPDELSPPKPLFAKQPWNQIITGKDWITHVVDADEWPHYQWLQLIRRTLIEDNNIELIDGIVHEDILWTIQLALAAKMMGFLEAPVYGYRINPKSITRNPSKEATAKRASSYLFILNHLAATASSLHEAPSTQKAIYTHMNREVGHFLGLLRKKLDNPAIRSELAKGYFKANLHRKIFKGIQKPGDLWRAFRSFIYLSYYASR